MYVCLCHLKRIISEKTSTFHSRGWNESYTDKRYLWTAVSMVDWQNQVSLCLNMSEKYARRFSTS